MRTTMGLNIIKKLDECYSRVCFTDGEKKCNATILPLEDADCSVLALFSNDSAYMDGVLNRLLEDKSISETVPEEGLLDHNDKIAEESLMVGAVLQLLSTCTPKKAQTPPDQSRTAGQGI